MLSRYRIIPSFYSVSTRTKWTRQETMQHADTSGEGTPKDNDRLYDTLLQLRNAENQQLWDRIKLILASQVGLLAFYAVTFKDLKDTYPTVVVFVAGLGLGLSVFLFQIIRGGLYWVIYWQKRMIQLEEKMPLELRIFSVTPSWTRGTKAGDALYPGVKYVSLSKTIRTLGTGVLIFWGVVFCFSLIAFTRLL